MVVSINDSSVWRAIPSHPRESCITEEYEGTAMVTMGSVPHHYRCLPYRLKVRLYLVSLHERPTAAEAQLILSIIAFFARSVRNKLISWICCVLLHCIVVVHCAHKLLHWFASRTARVRFSCNARSAECKGSHPVEVRGLTSIEPPHRLSIKCHRINKHFRVEC